MAGDHVTAQLDDYLDEQLDAAHREIVETHLATCAECRSELQATQKLRSVLAALPVSGPRPGFLDKAMQQARTSENTAADSGRSRMWLPAAMAAGLAVLLVGGLLLRQPGSSDADQLPMQAAADITMQLEEARTVNLVFESASPLEDVILTVDLPPGIELARYPGRMQMRWETSLQVGKNRLPLELVAIDGMGGEIVATMQSADTERVFTIDVAVVDG